MAAVVVMVSLQVASQKHTARRAREIKQRQRGRHRLHRLAAARQRSSGGENVRERRERVH